MKNKDYDKHRSMRSLHECYTPLLSKARHFGLTLDEEVENIKKEGISYTPSGLRRSIIGGLELRSGGERGASAYSKEVETLLIPGCSIWGTGLALRSLCLLLQALGIDYGFLRKQYCCGALVLHRVAVDGDLESWGKEFADKMSIEWIGLNIAEARKRKVKRMVYPCTWCAYLTSKFYSESDVQQLWYVDFLDMHLRGEKLHMEGQVGYFGGPSHMRWLHVQEENFDLNWPLARDMLNRIKGLEVIDIPRYCCHIAPDKIWESARQNGLHTIVVSCVVCYGSMVRQAPPDIEIRWLPDILLQALTGVTPREKVLQR